MYGVYTEHRNSVKPEANIEIWRYLTFTKFVSLLVNKSLFFSNLLVQQLSDPLEGTLPKKILDTYQELADSDDPNWKIATSGIEAGNKENNRYTSVNCWHMNTVESHDMWETYVPSGEGVAIRSTFNQLRSCFISSSDAKAVPVYIEVIQYFNHPEANKPAGIEFTSTVFKDAPFEYERELRAVIYLADQAHNASQQEKEEMQSGISIRVDLEKLISAIVLPPACPVWIKELIVSLLEQYEVKVPVEVSKL